MDMLDQLDTGVEKLLRTLAGLRAENARLREQLKASERQKSELTEENGKLRAVVVQEQNLRGEALARIKVLLKKIQDYDSIA